MKHKLFRFFLLFTILAVILSGCSTQNSKYSSKIGKVLEEYESTMHFISYSPEGDVTTQFDGTVNATFYENLSNSSYIGFLKTNLVFDTESFRFSTVMPDELAPCYYIANHRVCSLIIYDQELGCWSYQEIALDMENGRVAILFRDQNENTPLYLLVGSADPNADPAETITFFEDFIAHRWPQWWEQFQSPS